jgi:hypothetical protein
MSLPYDPRQSRDVLGVRSTLNRHLVRGISNSISETLANSTASNYNTDQFGRTIGLSMTGLLRSLQRSS